MKRLFYVLMFIFLLINISAVCEEGQIDINSASLEELDKLAGIGSTIAQNIINSRPFEFVDDLINTDGIAEKKLENIKSQGLACVDGEDDEIKEIGETENIIYENFSQKIQEKIELTPIILNSKNIKSEDNNESLKKNLAIGGITTFCVIFGALFFLKTRKRKNEFQ